MKDLARIFTELTEPLSVAPGRVRSAAAYHLSHVTDVHRLLSALAAEAGTRRSP